MGLDLVAVAAAVLLLDHVAGVGQVGDDAGRAAFRDVQAGRDVAQARAWVISDAQQDPGVVGQEGLARHPQYANRSWKETTSFILLVLSFRRSLRSVTGSQPPRAASYPGYRRTSCASA